YLESDAAMSASPVPVAPFDGDAYRILMEQVIAGNGLSAVARLLSDMLGLPATVADEEFQPLHAFAPRGRHLSGQEAGLRDIPRPEVSFDLELAPRASTSPPTARALSGDGCEYVVAPIVLPSGVVGYVWASDPSGHLSAWAEEAIAHAAAACTMEMVRQRAMVEGETRVRNSFLEDLLLGAVTSTTATRRRAKFLGYDLRGEQVVFVLDMDQFMEYINAKGEDESGIQRIKERFRRSVDASLPAMWSKTLVWEHSDSIVVLAPAGKDFQASPFVARVELLRSNVQKRLAGPTISAAIGRSSADLNRLRDSYQEAEHALRIGSAIYGNGATTSFDSLGAYRLLFHLRDQPELAMFCEETIGDLVRYDQERDSHLLETLTCLLDLQGNLSQAARTLHLHRNGLLYRISRIEKIAGCDLSNGSQRMALQLALLARPLLQRKDKKTA
ncbi:MAG: PucR family transcriptional regulator, partial [Chloroflexota bacterium]